MLLPFENAALLKDALVDIDKYELLTWDRYDTKPGDTLGEIAQRLDTRVDILRLFNFLAGSSIKTGKSLFIPRTNNPELLASAPQARKRSAPQFPQAPEECIEKSGDNL